MSRVSLDLLDSKHSSPLFRRVIHYGYKGNVIPFMANHPKPSAKNEQGEFGKFTNLLDRLLAVPHSEIKAKLDAEKKRKQRSKRRASSGHASGGKG